MCIGSIGIIAGVVIAGDGPIDVVVVAKYRVVFRRDRADCLEQTVIAVVHRVIVNVAGAGVVACYSATGAVAFEVVNDIVVKIIGCVCRSARNIDAPDRARTGGRTFDDTIADPEWPGIIERADPVVIGGGPGHVDLET